MSLSGEEKSGSRDAYRMYTIVPRHVREDLKWIAGLGTSVVCVAMLEQDLFAAADNISLVL